MKVPTLYYTKRQAKQAIPILKAAVKLLKTKHWCQGTLHTKITIPEKKKPSDAYCALGAIYLGSRGSKYVAEGALRSCIAENTPYSTIPGYNDRRRRTKNQVLGMFALAIKALQKIS